MDVFVWRVPEQDALRQTKWSAVTRLGQFSSNSVSVAFLIRLVRNLVLI